MTYSVGLLSNRVKKVPSTQVDENRYKFLRLQDSEPDLGVPPQDGNFLISSVTGERMWSTEVIFNQNQKTIDLHNSYSLKGNAELVETQEETVIASFSMTDYGSAKFLIQVFDQISDERQISELLVIHNQTIASATEYGIIYTGDEPLTTYDVDIDSASIVLTATAKTQNPLEYKISETLMLA